MGPNQDPPGYCKPISSGSQNRWVREVGWDVNGGRLALTSGLGSEVGGEVNWGGCLTDGIGK